MRPTPMLLLVRRTHWTPSRAQSTTPSTQPTHLRQAALFGFGGAYLPDNASADQTAAAAARIEAQRQSRLSEAVMLADPAEMIRCVFGRRLPMIGQFDVPAQVVPAMAGPAD